MLKQRLSKILGGSVLLLGTALLVGCQNQQQKPITKQQQASLQNSQNATQSVFQQKPDIKYANNFNQYQQIKVMNKNQKDGSSVKHVQSIMHEPYDIKEDVKLTNNQKGNELLWRLDKPTEKKNYQYPAIYVITYQNQVLAKGYNGNHKSRVPVNIEKAHKNMSFEQVQKILGQPFSIQETPDTQTLSYIISTKDQGKLGTITIVNGKVTNIKNN